jgi:uncharacterized protein YjiK
MRYISILLLVFLLVGSCNASKETKEIKDPATDESKSRTPNSSTISKLGYDFMKPAQTRELPPVLNEISALGIDDNGYLLAVQDEKGSIFRITPDSIYEYPFRKEGDYEGVERVGDDIFVVKNTGTLYQVSNLETDVKVKKHKSYLNEDYDIEGLCYDVKTNGLLLIAKDDSDLDKDHRGIFRFDLATYEMDSLPFMKLDVKAIYDYMASHDQKKTEFKKLLEEADLEGDRTFAPSAIAIHPYTGNYYVTSSRGKLLAVLDRKGNVVHVEKLKKSIHRQPEGLTFDKDGHLYISNEGREGQGTVHQIKWVK